MQKFILSFIASLILFAGCLIAGEEYDPLSVYLTWQQKPDTTMIVQWITPMDEKADLIEFRSENETQWHQQEGSHKPLPERLPYLIHRVDLQELIPDSGYLFRIGPDGKTYKFRTLPSTLTHPVNFVSGGDMYNDSLQRMEKTNIQAAKTSPFFALIGGDIAYSSRKFWFLTENGQRWLDWLAAWKRTMVTPEGYMIPVIPAIGNHETNGQFDQTPQQAPFFYALFPTRGYMVLDAGDYLSLFFLDTNHTHPINGKQTNWLQKALAERTERPHKLAIYHVPAYPSKGSYYSRESSMIRKCWVPLFEKYGLNAAFEHHAHTYKRTHLIKEGKVSDSGVLYIGDGAWGAENLRTPRTPVDAWYLAKTQSVNHFIMTSIDRSARSFTAIDSSGKVIDKVFQRK